MSLISVETCDNDKGVFRLRRFMVPSDLAIAIGLAESLREHDDLVATVSRRSDDEVVALVNALLDERTDA